MSPLPQKRTSMSAIAMSALCQKPDIREWVFSAVQPREGDQHYDAGPFHFEPTARVVGLRTAP
jgi:hypothetical protein